jgi:hypothetical protein
MKAEIVYNTKDEPRILLTLESPQDGIRMADQPNLELVTIETSVHGPTKMAYAIVPSHAFQLHEDGEIQPLSAAEMTNPAYAMRGGKSEADYQRFIGRYKATVMEALDECNKLYGVLDKIRAESENDVDSEMDSLLICVNLAADAISARSK